MNDRPNIESLLKLPAGERLALVEALWDSLTADPTSLPVPDWRLDIVKQRIAEDDLALEDGAT
jgi:putative addiction module component (TIGR02574 family)